MRMLIRSLLRQCTGYPCKLTGSGISYRRVGLGNTIRVIGHSSHQSARQSSTQTSTAMTELVNAPITPNGTSRPRQTITSNNPSSLTVTDSLYGSITITSRVLLSLIHDPSFQRLHGIHQHGITPIINVNKVRPSVSRFEHSLGAMLLIHTLAPEDKEQQCAALLHDISHTVLSHVTDFAFGYVIHEVEKPAYVQTTNIPRILAEFGMDWKYITSEEQGVWTLLEQPAPLLCADRLDYGLRDMIAFDIVPASVIRQIVQQFVVHEKRIMCSNVELAGVLARGYMRCDQLAWANPHHSGLYKFAGDAIRLALQHGVIKKDELWQGTDEEFWSKIVNCGISEIDEKTKYVNEHTNYEIVPRTTRGIGDGVLQLKLKLRTIDPEIVIHGKGGTRVMRLSDVDEAYKRERKEYIESTREPILLKVS